MDVTMPDLSHEERIVLNFLHRRPDTHAKNLPQSAQEVVANLIGRGLVREAIPANKWSRAIGGAYVQVAEETMAAVVADRAWESPDFVPDFIGVEADAWLCHHVFGHRVHTQIVTEQFEVSRGEEKLLVAAVDDAADRFYYIAGPVDTSAAREQAGLGRFSFDYFEPTTKPDDAEKAAAALARRYGFKVAIPLIPTGKDDHRRGIQISDAEHDIQIVSGAGFIASTLGVRLCLAAMEAIRAGMIPAAGDHGHMPQAGGQRP
jgi:hypothetical protein